MPLARLENFLKNINGNTLYVDPNELDATDSIENRGNSRLRPFKTIQRALVEASRFAYVAGSNNDLFDQTTIMISPGTHYIDNRPGYYVDASNIIKDIGNSTKSISEFNILSNFDITDPANQLYIFNSVDGGVILPKGTSLVASDLRKTKIRPLFVPDPASGVVAPSSIFNLTGACYFFGFSIYDADPLSKVYNTYSTTTVTPNFSHHKLTAFQYADGVNKVVRNGSNTGHTDLEMYYYKLALAYGPQSTRSVIDGYLNFQPSIDEYRIVGDLGSGPITISSVISGDGINGTNVITVTTETEHNLSALSPILISGVGQLETQVTQLEYNGNFVVAQILSPTQFTYLLSAIPSQTLQPSAGGALVKVISDTTTSSSPYIFNCSLKSVYGLNGLHADGSKSTGFKSVVTAQFTGISLQKDDRAFVKYDATSSSYQDQDALGVTEFLHQDTNSVYHPDWQSTHIKASNDAFIQCVSIFAIGYANQFVAKEGADQSITNSNSNFGERALFSEGFKNKAFSKDDHGFITHIIPPKDISSEKQNINTYTINLALPNSNTKIYLTGYTDILNAPNAKVRGYSIGGADADQISYSASAVEYYADITPRYKINTNITSIDTVANTLTLASVSGISTGLSVKLISKDANLPDGITNNQTYFARISSGNNVKLYDNLANCQVGISEVNIENSVGLTANNLYFVSKVSDINAGDVGSPIQWDNTVKNWYIGITTNAGSPNFISHLSLLTSNPTVYVKRIIDTRSNDNKAYRVRYVIPKESTNVAIPAAGSVIQKSGHLLNPTYGQSSSTNLADPTGDVLAAVRNKNIIVDAWYNSGTATVVTKYPHHLKNGNKIGINNLRSANEPNPVGLGTGTGFNGNFVVASVVDDITFTYTIPVNPGAITAGASSTQNWLSTRDCAQTSNFRVAPYTIYDTNRATLPYFTCDQIGNHYQAYKVDQIQPYIAGSSDGIYYITLDVYKNTPSISPFNTSEYKFGQNLDYLYPKLNFDTVIADPDPTATVASRQSIGLSEVSDPYLSSTKEGIIEYLKDFDLGTGIEQITQSGSSTTITTASDHGLGGIRRVVAGTLNSGFTNGTYYDIPLCGGTGKNATINVTVSGGTPTLFEIANPGSGYSVGDTLTVKGIPGSTNTITVTIPPNLGLFFDPNDSNTIQVLGASNVNNNGVFVITSVTANTITYTNALGVTEATTNSVFILSGIGYPIDSAVYNSGTNITTVTTSSLAPHSFSVGNKVIFDAGGLGVCPVTSVAGITTFTVNGDAHTATRVYSIGLIPTLKDANALNENLNTRDYAVFSGYKGRIGQDITSSVTNFAVDNIQGLKKGDFIQVDSEIMLITSVSGGTVNVKRALFGTQPSVHSNHAAIKTIDILPVELRRPSILRASSHTFEYTGFGPGNYSTAMPSNQTEVLSDAQISISQALTNRGGSIFYTGMNSNGDFFIGKKKFDAATGNEIQPPTDATAVVSDFDTLTVNKLIVNNEINATTAFENLKNLNVSGISTFNSGINATGIVTATTFVGNGTIPVGGIIMWSGSIVSIPTGWALCNGSSGTPDLRSRFIVGAGSGYAVAATGGADSVTLNTTQIPSHNHTLTDPGHFHYSNDPGIAGNYGGYGSGSGGGGLGGIGGRQLTDTRTTGITIDNAGGGLAHENRPPYYALAFIMRTV